MAITASGLYGLTLEKMFIDTAGQSLEAETHNVMLVLDSYTPNFDTDDFRDDVTEITIESGYTSGGNNLLGTELTLATGTMTYDSSPDAQWTTATITNAMAAVGYFDVGTAGTDQLIFLSDFVTAASSSAGTFTIQWNASGIFTLDYTP